MDLNGNSDHKLHGRGWLGRMLPEACERPWGRGECSFLRERKSLASELSFLFHCACVCVYIYSWSGNILFPLDCPV